VHNNGGHSFLHSECLCIQRIVLTSHHMREMAACSV